MKCEVCSGASWRTLYPTEDYVTGDRFEIVQCTSCGLACTSPLPEDLAKYYPDIYYGNKMRRFPKPVEGLIAQSRRERAADVQRIVRPRTGGSPAVLDVGCGRALMLTFLKDLGWRCSGTEMSQHSAEGAREKGLDVRIGALQPGMFEAESFDCVTLYHVLEHLPDPRRTLQECHRLLRPGGVLVVAVPDWGSWQAQWGGPLWFHLDPPRHLYHFDRRVLERLVRDLGFRPFRWRFFAPVYDLYGWLQTALNRMGFPIGLLYRLQHVNQRYRTPSPLLALAALIAAIPAGILGLLLTLLGMALRNGSTMEVWATRE
ncbi:MAG: class I SAM-dependent methyltransferase [Candidatus Xenobia bacterium]